METLTSIKSLENICIVIVLLKFCNLEWVPSIWKEALGFILPPFAFEPPLGFPVMMVRVDCGVVLCQELLWTLKCPMAFSRVRSKGGVRSTRQICWMAYPLAEPLHSQTPHQKELLESLLVSRRQKSCSGISCTIVLSVTCSARSPQRDSILPHPSPQNDSINVR